MKRILLLSMSLAIMTSFAQTQQGYVKTKGRLASNGTVIAGSRIPGATVQVKGRTSVLSQSNGTFSFPIPAQNFYLQSVQKQGYVMTDPDMLSRQYAYSKNPLILVLETKEQQDDDKLAAERKIRSTLRRQLQEKEDEIESLKEQQKLSEEDYRKQLQEIYAQQKNNEKLIGEMADRYSRMDFDEVDEFNRRISQLILDGKLTEADSLINAKGDINTRATVLRQHQEANAQAEQEIKKRQKKLEKSKAMTQKELEDLAQDCYSKFEIFKLLHQNDSAAYYIALRSELDSTNVEWKLEFSSFISDYMGIFEKAKEINETALNLALNQYNEDSPLVLECLKSVGLMHNELGEYKDAISSFMRGIIIAEQSADSFYDILQGLYNDLAVVYDNERDFERALVYHEKAVELRKQLYGEESEQLAVSYNNIGFVYSRMRKYEKALEYYNKALAIQNKIFGEEHQDVGMTLINIGGVYWEQKDFEKALAYFISGQKILETILSPSHPKIGLGYNNIASAYDGLGNYEKAIEYNRKALSILEKNLGENHPQVANLYGNMSGTYENLKQYDTSIKYLQQAIRRFTNAFGVNSQNSIHVAVHYGAIGRLYNKIGDKALAEQSFIKCLDIEKNILKSPNVYLFNAYLHLADFYLNNGEFVKAKDIYTEMLNVTLAVYGQNSREATNNYGSIYLSLISEYQKTKTKETLQEFQNFMSSHAITATVLSKETPAATQGMDGEYYFLACENWEMQQPQSVLEAVTSLQGKPKDIVVMQNGVISKHHFENAMGMVTGFKQIDKKEMDNIIQKYNKWKTSNYKK